MLTTAALLVLALGYLLAGAISRLTLQLGLGSRVARAEGTVTAVRQRQRNLGVYRAHVTFTDAHGQKRAFDTPWSDLLCHQEGQRVLVGYDPAGTRPPVERSTRLLIEAAAHVAVLLALMGGIGFIAWRLAQYGWRW